MAKDKFTIAETDMRVPAFAKAATRSAYRRVRASGSDVVVVRDRQISRIDSSGDIFLVKTLEPATRINKGTLIPIKSGRPKSFIFVSPFCEFCGKVPQFSSEYH